MERVADGLRWGYTYLQWGWGKSYEYVQNNLHYLPTERETLTWIIAALTVACILQWMWLRDHKEGKQMGKEQSPQLQHAVLRNKMTQVISDAIDDAYAEGTISLEVAGQARKKFGLGLNMTALVPRNITTEEVKKRIHKNLGLHSVPKLPDAVDVSAFIKAMKKS